MSRESSHVHFVHNGLRGRVPQRYVAFPVVRARVDHDALHRAGGVLARSGRRVTTVRRRNRHATAVRIEENLGGIEPHPSRRVGGPLDSVAVHLARLHARHEDVPVVVRAVGRGIDGDHERGPGVVDAIEEQQLDPSRVPREHAEVRAGRPKRRSQW